MLLASDSTDQMQAFGAMVIAIIALYEIVRRFNDYLVNRIKKRADDDRSKQEQETFEKTIQKQTDDLTTTVNGSRHFLEQKIEVADAHTKTEIKNLSERIDRVSVHKDEAHTKLWEATHENAKEIVELRHATKDQLQLIVRNQEQHDLKDDGRFDSVDAKLDAIRKATNRDQTKPEP